MPSFFGLLNRDPLMVDIDHEQRIGQSAHVLDTANRALKLLHHARAVQRFFFGELVESTVIALLFQLAVVTNRGADRFVVGEHAAQPAMADIRHATTLGLLLDQLLRGALGAHENELVAARGDLAHLLQSPVEGRHRVLEVDDVNLVARAKDIRAHLGVPVAGLVAEVDTRLQHVAHADSGHSVFLCFGLNLHIPHRPTPKGTQDQCAGMCVALAHSAR